MPQAWLNTYQTSNYVLYQPFQAGDSVVRTNPSAPNTCLVYGIGRTYSSLLLGLGAVNPQCRVSHFGSQNDLSATVCVPAFA